MPIAAGHRLSKFANGASCRRTNRRMTAHIPRCGRIDRTGTRSICRWARSRRSLAVHSIENGSGAAVISGEAPNVETRAVSLDAVKNVLSIPRPVGRILLLVVPDHQLRLRVQYRQTHEEIECIALLREVCDAISIRRPYRRTFVNVVMTDLFGGAAAIEQAELGGFAVCSEARDDAAIA